MTIEFDEDPEIAELQREAVRTVTPIVFELMEFLESKDLKHIERIMIGEALAHTLMLDSGSELGAVIAEDVGRIGVELACEVDFVPEQLCCCCKNAAAETACAPTVTESVLVARLKALKALKALDTPSKKVQDKARRVAQKALKSALKDVVKNPPAR